MSNPPGTGLTEYPPVVRNKADTSDNLVPEKTNIYLPVVRNKADKADNLPVVRNKADQSKPPRNWPP